MDNATDGQLHQKKEPDITSPFQSLWRLPEKLSHSQCVLHKQEILICGGIAHNCCYSYHILKKQYRLICSYPKHVELSRHCVVKLAGDNKNTNEITLLSFGGSQKISRHTLMMKYVSVWSGAEANKSENNGANKTMEPRNEWIPFTDENNKLFQIGRKTDNYVGVRAVIGGSANHLLFITYHLNNIDVLNLNTFQYIQHGILPDCSIFCHSFASKTTSNQNMKKKITEMVLFCKQMGLLIKYNETTNSFTFQKLQRKKVVKCEKTLPLPLYDCTGVLHKEMECVHIIGGSNSRGNALSTHMKTDIKQWLKEDTKKEKRWIAEERDKVDIEQIQIELDESRDKIVTAKLTKKKEIAMILQHWHRSLSIKMNWADDCNTIVSQYILVCCFLFFFLGESNFFCFCKKKMKYFRQWKVLQGHSDHVQSVKFSPDYEKLVSCSEDKTVRIWDIRLGTSMQTLNGHCSRVNDARFSPDKKTIVSCSDDCTIRLWDLQSGKEFKKLETHSSVTSVQFSPDGVYIISGSIDGSIRLWDGPSGRALKSLQGHSRAVNDVEFSHNSRKCVSASGDTSIGIWNVRSGKIIRTLNGHLGSVEKAKFSSDNRFIISCSADATIRIWNATLGTGLMTLNGHLGMTKDVALFPNEQIIVSCSLDNTIRLWNRRLGMLLQTLRGHSKGLSAVDISSDGNIIVSASYDKTLRLWRPL
ncbi:hypothetical protein RFI_12799 [Reticulomyxa filosa]|uniref:Uncharacterized protein n=1 Tax=Reticulomyxa filosa TaxID=46433 RepID=X6NEN7_RETFI|nr:hypothetical protein RFI_12799 [Reticulomyxa filosa]|eukprot:ETO24358.1 hypothetical protein RFI_12799 [Reticulomyxa filosa]